MYFKLKFSFNMKADNTRDEIKTEIESDDEDDNGQTSFDLAKTNFAVSGI